MRALVLSGGANRGALQAGALPVLLEAGIGFDLLVGTSVGAFHAAFLASAPTLRRARELLQVWRDLRAPDLVAGSRSGCVWNALRRRDHLCSARPLRRLIDRQVALRRLEEAVVPTVVVATELHTGSERRFTTGPIVDLVAASAALPGVFPPVVHEGDLLVDGGVLAPVPLGAALDEGATEVWILDVAQPCTARPPPRTFVDCLLQALALRSGARTLAELACPPPGVAIHHLRLPCRTPRWFTDLSGTEELLVDGERTARQYLSGLATPASGGSSSP